MNQTLDVTIVSPYETLFSGLAGSVSSKNSEGPFDILAEHANFITIIENSPIVIRKPGKDVITFSFPIAIIHVENDRVRIYAQIQFPKL